MPKRASNPPEGLLDRADYQKLLGMVLRQAMDDYVKLQHPQFRSKKYLQEAFDHAVDMLFDSDYRFLCIKNDEEECMTLKELVGEVLETGSVETDKLKNYLVDESVRFWETKVLRTVYIPDSLIVDGHVYSVIHTEDDDPSINYEDKMIYINKKSDNSDNQEAFVLLVAEAIAYHNELTIAQKTLRKFGSSLFRCLRINSCFTGHS